VEVSRAMRRRWPSLVLGMGKRRGGEGQGCEAPRRNPCEKEREVLRRRGEEVEGRIRDVRGWGSGGVRAKAREVAMWRRRRVIVGRVHGVSITAGEMPGRP